ncbi:IS66 family insertion sequence element accessory protein TnpB [Alkalicoccus luteus]|uniref:IS66 family insertion sequence element accessory protein TnpB n=1 Tax=Alkalicoccus luteus TaxID=1237094 RepID=A0A969PUJ7_9BACI|nr:IS66 family insertion sequence element accessory protein TnpB [Alkalicoccus luteus]NJP39404.1 IS66 family insertion sequence element accessory protein TnpB [Alkalicoccus luteus]
MRANQRVFLAHGEIDMRLGIDGLAALVQERFQLDPCRSDLFVFCGRDKTRIKILHWDHNGFWLYYRRLETGRFPWPDGDEAVPSELTGRQLRWLLNGLRIEDGKVFAPPTGTSVI